jgi:putative thymidine phosphorylase
METLAPVALDLATMRRVVEHEGGCVVWGGAMALSPADDVLIRVERPLDFDSQGQLAASVLSKKIAAGSTHLLIDVPVGPTAKLRDKAAAELLGTRLREVGQALGLTLQIVETDGSQPVGRGIGPALEARDVLAVLQNASDAPADLRERSLLLAAYLLELGGRAQAGAGAALAQETLTSGAAWRKFEAICAAQGGMRTPPLATYRQIFKAHAAGVVSQIDNRRLARIAKLAGAPKSPAAGLELHRRVGDAVERDEPLFTLHAESPGELTYAAAYADAHADTIRIGDHAGDRA